MIGGVYLPAKAPEGESVSAVREQVPATTMASPNPVQEDQPDGHEDGFEYSAAPGENGDTEADLQGDEAAEGFHWDAIVALTNKT